MNYLKMNNYLCDYKLACVPSEYVPTNCLDSLTKNLTGFSKEMVLMSWLQEVYDYSISLHSVRFKTNEGSFVNNLNEFLNSPDIAITMSQDDLTLFFDIEVIADKNFKYEITIHNKFDIYSISLTENFNNKNSKFFSFEKNSICENPIDLAVYLQFKAETIYDESISLDINTIIEFLELFGAKMITGDVVNFKNINLHFEREKRCEKWYQATYELIDNKIGEKTKDFLRNNVNVHDFKDQISFFLNNYLDEFGVKDILNEDDEITDIAINRPTEFWY
ncbi:hypothetical protein, partial [Acinetobacter pittii]|uniref:hypothetical protein n=1 Tax=Acinetobacter pittii TaxID=48296 RepID=UPI001430F4FB